MQVCWERSHKWRVHGCLAACAAAGLVWYKRSGHIIVLRQCANALHGILVKLLTEASTV